MIFFYCAIAAFTITSAINMHLQTEFKPHQVLARKITKSALMPLLALVLLATTLINGNLVPASGGISLSGLSETVSTNGMVTVTSVQVLFVALFFSWVGDVCLIWTGNKAFLAGLTSFLLGHIAYLAFFSNHVDYSRLPLAFWGLALVIAWYGVILFKGVGPTSYIRFGMLFYMLVISGMIFSAMAMFYQQLNLNGFLVLLGAMLFGSSDSVLAFKRIAKNTILPESYVMFSYISGQFLIIIGATLWL